MIKDAEPSVWIGCIACYNEGNLIGAWFQAIEAATVTSADLHANRAAAASHDELWCYDHEGLPVDGELDPVTATAWGELWEEVPEHLWPALCAWVRTGEYVAQEEGDLPSIPAFEDRFCGTWGSFRDYAEHLAEEADIIPADAPETLVRYFDWNAWTRDLEHEYTVVLADWRSVYVFRDL